jgi:hypothetical protein
MPGTTSRQVENSALPQRHLLALLYKLNGSPLFRANEPDFDGEGSRPARER